MEWLNSHKLASSYQYNAQVARIDFAGASCAACENWPQYRILAACTCELQTCETDFKYASCENWFPLAHAFENQLSHACVSWNQFWTLLILAARALRNQISLAGIAGLRNRTHSYVHLFHCSCVCTANYFALPSMRDLICSSRSLCACQRYLISLCAGCYNWFTPHNSARVNLLCRLYIIRIDLILHTRPAPSEILAGCTFAHTCDLHSVEFTSGAVRNQFPSELGWKRMISCDA